MLDKIEFNRHGPTVAPKHNRGYSLSITPGEIVISIKSYSQVLLTKTRPFTREKFDALLHCFKDLNESTKAKEDEKPVGGGFDTITFYKDGKEIFNSSNKEDLSGAEVDLSYLVTDLSELIESTKTDK